MAAGTAAAVDSSICQIICFIVGKLQCNATSDNGDNKIGCKATKIDWKVPPTFWPKDICFVNPNTNLTTPKKWSMLFAALSCLLRKDIDTFLSKKENFVLCVEMMALECSNLDILNQCHELRKLMKLDMSCLKNVWVKEIFLDDLRSFGLPLAETLTGLECNRLLSLYDDLEKECRNGQLPDFLKKLKSFRSMKSLDAEVALNVAKECLEHESTRTKRSGSSPGLHGNNKIPKTSGNSSQNAGKQAIGTPGLPTTPITVTQATASSLCNTKDQGRQTTASQISTTTSHVMPTTFQKTTPIPTIQNSLMQTSVSSTPAASLCSIHNSGMQPTAAPIQPTQIGVLQPATSPGPVAQSSVISFDDSYSTAATTHFRSQSVCTTSVLSTQTTATTSLVSPVNTNNPLLSSSGSHTSFTCIPLDTSRISRHDQAPNTCNDGSPSQGHFPSLESQPLFPDNR